LILVIRRKAVAAIIGGFAGPEVANPFKQRPRNKMFKVEKTVEEDSTVLRLVGRVKAEHLADLRILIADERVPVQLDLSEVTLVDLDVICFLGDYERCGVRLVNCSSYVREWIRREQTRH